YGQWAGLFAATLVYTLVHVWSFNFMLIMAAMVCGAFWGLIYKYNRSLTTLIVSHALWDLMVFIVFPIV
ncbi:MAG TPA: CPBP family glutamic-type intramembrane protease, partial [Spirochaetota bacterium]|nr:CPBP family glutamic-type intramembrane protease [Spirochaetota bacterium]